MKVQIILAIFISYLILDSFFLPLTGERHLPVGALLPRTGLQGPGDTRADEDNATGLALPELRERLPALQDGALSGLCAEHDQQSDQHVQRERHDTVHQRVLSALLSAVQLCADRGQAEHHLAHDTPRCGGVHTRGGGPQGSLSRGDSGHIA